MRTRGLAHINGHRKSTLQTTKKTTPDINSDGQKKRPATRTDAHTERERRAEGERDREAHTHRAREGKTHAMRDMQRGRAQRHTQRERHGDVITSTRDETSNKTERERETRGGLVGKKTVFPF